MSEDQNITEVSQEVTDEKPKKKKGGFQKGNKMASKAVKKKAEEEGRSLKICNDPDSTVGEVLKARNISSANEMIKAAKAIKDKNQRFRAWMEIRKFEEGQRRQVDIKVDKTETKNINIIYKGQGLEKLENEKLKKSTEEIVEAEFQEVMEEEVIDEENVSRD